MSLQSLNLLFLSLLQDGGPGEQAADAPSSPLLPLLAVGAIFWFVLIAPERKKRKQRENQMSALKKGDKVMTTSGIYATIVQLQDDVATLQIADGVRVKFSRAAIQGPVDEEAKSTASPTNKSKSKQDEPAPKELAANSN